MELRDYLRITRRRWKLIVGCLVTAVGMAALVTVQTTPLYSSSARIFVSTSPSSSSDAYQGSLFSVQRVTSYADLVNGRELSSRVIDQLGLDMEPDELTGKIESIVVPETVLLELTVTDPSPEQAQILAQTVADELTGFVAELETPPGRSRAPIKATIVDTAALPTSPVSPQPLRNVGIAAILGLLLGLGAAVLRDLLDTTVKNQEELTEATGAPVMANIAYDADASKRPLITSLDSHAPRVEAFRVLRTNMQFVNVDKASKVFVVTSSLPEEGKTTTATNLAITLAQAGQRILLVDGDLRRPHVAENLRLESAVGLTTVLVGRLPLAEAIQAYSVPNLSVLTSGAVPPNPSELLQSEAMRELLAQLRGQFDIVVIDAPPLLPVTDAALIASQSDGALLVVRHGRTTRDQVKHSIARLESVDARAIGVVLNRVPSHRSSDAYYGYGYGYGYAPETDKRPDKSSKHKDERAPEETTSSGEMGFTKRK